MGLVGVFMLYQQFLHRQSFPVKGNGKNNRLTFSSPTPKYLRGLHNLVCGLLLILVCVCQPNEQLRGKHTGLYKQVDYK
ncbi:hypothetical protein XELAEV_18036205mg [Xenopus laevis]|uniref:Uncharacterized protein n=1 Tax=Xenopus laevis TaxID=8355 RepID=A0A974CH17_XENLA|nr:hypothetical protein XELAEV_18036205mg [Xenopus laevis]